jgi:formylmethanofuran dehydrogenase subunit E
MAIYGLEQIEIGDPKGDDRKKLYLFVEIDRCATDALQSVTGCSLGRRTMKFMDYGKMAATFVNLRTGKSVRVVAREEARKKAKEYAPEGVNKYQSQVEAYKVMPVEDLFSLQEVTVHIPKQDMPGRPMSRVRCKSCGEYVQDRRETYAQGMILCRPCAFGGYCNALNDFSSFCAVQNSHNEIEVKSKLWLEIDGEPFFGRGRRYLLEAIESYGSINQAAKQINISYRKAWSYIKAMEERLGLKLVERHVGGRYGGGAALTAEAKVFLKKYALLEEGMNEVVDNRFMEIFGARS